MFSSTKEEIFRIKVLVKKKEISWDLLITNNNYFINEKEKFKKGGKSWGEGFECSGDVYKKVCKRCKQV